MVSGNKSERIGCRSGGLRVCIQDDIWGTDVLNVNVGLRWAMTGRLNGYDDVHEMVRQRGRSWRLGLPDAAVLGLTLVRISQGNQNDKVSYLR